MQASVLALFSKLLLHVFAVKHVPFSRARRDAPRERLDLLPHHVVEAVVAAEELLEHLLGRGERARLVGEIGEVVLPHAVYDEMREMRDAAFRQPAHRTKPFFCAIFCLIRRNILCWSISPAWRTSPAWLASSSRASSSSSSSS